MKLSSRMMSLFAFMFSLLPILTYGNDQGGAFELIGTENGLVSKGSQHLRRREIQHGVKHDAFANDAQRSIIHFLPGPSEKSAAAQGNKRNEDLEANRDVQSKAQLRRMHQKHERHRHSKKGRHNDSNEGNQRESRQPHWDSSSRSHTSSSADKSMMEDGSLSMSSWNKSSSESNTQSVDDGLGLGTAAFVASMVVPMIVYFFFICCFGNCTSRWIQQWRLRRAIDAYERRHGPLRPPFEEKNEEEEEKINQGIRKELKKLIEGTTMVVTSSCLVDDAQGYHITGEAFEAFDDCSLFSDDDDEKGGGMNKKSNDIDENNNTTNIIKIDKNDCVTKTDNNGKNDEIIKSDNIGKDYQRKNYVLVPCPGEIRIREKEFSMEESVQTDHQANEEVSGDSETMNENKNDCSHQATIEAEKKNGIDSLEKRETTDSKSVSNMGDHNGDSVVDSDTKLSEDQTGAATSLTIIPRKDAQDESDNLDSNKSTPNENTQSTGSSLSRLRAVGNQCVICFSSYQIGDKVCWSSNQQCVHVFHEECIISWLARMEGGVACPNCRQDFIVDGFIDFSVIKRNVKREVASEALQESNQSNRSGDAAGADNDDDDDDESIGSLSYSYAGR